MNFLFIQIMAVISEWRGWKHHDQYNNENNAVVYHFLQIMAPTYICMLSVILLAERLSSLTTAFHTGISTSVIIALFKEGSKAIQDCISVALLCSMACWENLFNPLNQSNAKMKPLYYQWQWGRGGGFPTFELHCKKHRIVFFVFAFSYTHSSHNLGNVLRQVNMKYFKLRSDIQSCGCNNFGVRQVHVVIKTDKKRGGVPLDPPMLCFYTLSSNTFWYYIYLLTGC